MVTEAAFRVSPDLLGIPLASHPKRVIAILIDLALIGLIANQAGGIALGLLAAIFFFRMAIKSRRNGAGVRNGRATVEGEAGALGPQLTTTQAAVQTTLRGTAGCMGAIILFVTIVVVVYAGPWSGIFRSSPSPSPGQPQVTMTTSEALQDIPPETRERLEDMGLTRILERELGDDPSREEVEEVLTREFGSWLGGVMGGTARPESADPQSGRADPDVAEAVDPDPPEPSDPATAADTIQTEVTDPELAALHDSLRALSAAYERERGERTRVAERSRALRSDVARLEAEAEEGPSIRSLLRGLLEDLGVGIGWGALYFSVFLTWWKGRTPGKRLLGLRVVRLDQGSITWWTALERYGGYAAGFATGLLGFLQVTWDPNRQATHDKIAGTVVIQEGKPPLPGFGNTANP